MKTTRRKLLKLIPGAASLPLFAPFIGSALASPSKGSEVNEPNARKFFSALGYREIPPLDLITGDAFNDGVRYDESMPGGPKDGKTLIFQNCIRVEDINSQDRPGILPYFHILSLSIKGASPRAEIMGATLDYLVNHLKLDAGRLYFVSTEVFIPYMRELSSFGISDTQFVLRDKKEAMATGDGSGYFAPAGHPHAVPFHSVSIHYAQDPAVVPQELTYPLSNFLEIGEIMIHEDAPGIEEIQVAGLGVERLLMALGAPAESYDQSLEKARIALEEEAKRRNVPLPPAYEKLKTS